MMRNISFNTKIVLGFLGLLGISIGTLSWFATRSHEEHLRRTSLAHLEEVADGRVERFRIVTSGLEGEIRLARDYYNIQRNLPVVIELAGSRDDPRYGEAKAMLDQQLAAYREVAGYADFVLADREGRIVYVLDPGREARLLGRTLPYPGAALLNGASKGIDVSPVFQDPWIEDRFVLLVASPAVDRSGEKVGFIVLVVDVARMLRPVWTTAGLGPTARVVVGQRTNGDVFCLCPQGDQDLVVRPMKLADAEVEGMMKAALAGGKGSAVAGNVVAAWRPMEDLGLGLIVQQEAAEVFAPAARLRQSLGTAAGFVFLAALLGSLALGREITRPVRRIAQAAEGIAAGDLSRRAEVGGNDEVGVLANAFNRMAAGLIDANASLEGRNADLSRLNQDLRDLQARIETQYQALNRAAIVSETDVRGRIVYANDMFVAISGYTREELLGQDHRIINSGYHPKSYFEEMWATISGGEVWTGEIRNRAKSGRHYWVDTAIAPILGPDGKPKGYLAIRFDVTARKELEERLVLYREIIANSSDAIAILDADARYAEQNEAHRRLLGYEDVEIVGRTPEFYLEPGTFPAIIGSLEAEGFYRGEMTNRTRDGRTIDIELSAFVIRNEAGEVVRYVGFKRDVTERKRTDERIRSLNSELGQRVQELAALNRELEAFSYSVSHDLRAPLRSLDGFSLALLEDYGDRLDATGRDYLQRIRASSQRMGDLIDDMLMLSRVTRREMAVQRIDLSALVRSVVDNLRSQHEGRTVEVVVPDGLAVEGDPHLVRILLDNLLGNAWKFTAKRPDARIEFGSTVADGDLAFYVRDNGAGFDMRYAGKLFGIFQRLHGADEFPGTGIGLATVQRIVHRHGGRVWAEGELDRGATFYFVI